MAGDIDPTNPYNVGGPMAQPASGVLDFLIRASKLSRDPSWGLSFVNEELERNKERREASAAATGFNTGEVPTEVTHTRGRLGQLGEKLGILGPPKPEAPYPEEVQAATYGSYIKAQKELIRQRIMDSIISRRSKEHGEKVDRALKIFSDTGAVTTDDGEGIADLGILPPKGYITPNQYRQELLRFKANSEGLNAAKFREDLKQHAVKNFQFTMTYNLNKRRLIEAKTKGDKKIVEDLTKNMRGDLSNHLKFTLGMLNGEMKALEAKGIPSKPDTPQSKDIVDRYSMLKEHKVRLLKEYESQIQDLEKFKGSPYQIPSMSGEMEGLMSGKSADDLKMKEEEENLRKLMEKGQ